MQIASVDEEEQVQGARVLLVPFQVRKEHESLVFVAVFEQNPIYLVSLLFLLLPAGKGNGAEVASRPRNFPGIKF